MKKGIDLLFASSPFQVLLQKISVNFVYTNGRKPTSASYFDPHLKFTVLSSLITDVFVTRKAYRMRGEWEENERRIRGEWEENERRETETHFVFSPQKDRQRKSKGWEHVLSLVVHEVYCASLLTKNLYKNKTKKENARHTVITCTSSWEEKKSKERERIEFMNFPFERKWIAKLREITQDLWYNNDFNF